MFCPKCGKEIPENVKFCPKCGTAVSNGAAGAASENPAAHAGWASAARGKSGKAAAVRPEKKRKAEGAGEKDGKRKGPGRKILIAAAVLIAVLILWPKSPASDASDASEPNGSAGIGQGALGGIPTDNPSGDPGSGSTEDPGTDSPDGEDAVELGKDGKRSLRGESKEYKENYNYVFDHQSEIIAAYYQNTRDTAANNFKGTFNALRDIVAGVDPSLLDMLALDIAADNADSFLGMHLLYSGVNAYFSDSELGRGLRDISENLILYAVQDSYQTPEDRIRKDELVFCGGNMDYALMQSRGTIEEILIQMSVDSGYQSAIPALDWYYKQIFDIMGENISEEIGIMWNGGGDQEAVQVKWDALRGRMDAVEDCKQGWENATLQWMSAFFSDIGMDINAPVNSDQRIYAIFDKDGKQHGVFTATNLSSPTLLADGSCVFTEGQPGGGTVFRKVDRDGKTVFSYDGSKPGSPEVGSDGAQDVHYFPIAPCGNILRSSTRSDFDHGNYTSLEWVRPDGSAAELLSGWNFDVSAHFMDPHYDGITRNVNAFYVAANDASCDLFRVTYRTFENEKTTVYVDMETGEIHDEAGYGEGGSYSPVTGGINARYSWDKKNIREKANPDRIVADLSGGGGAERIFWDEIHDEYWVSTENGYYYVLDNSFQRIREPVQLPGKLYDLSPFGVIAYEESGGLGMYDASGKQLYTFPSADPVGFIAGNFNLNTGEALTLTLGGK